MALTASGRLRSQAGTLQLEGGYLYIEENSETARRLGTSGSAAAGRLPLPNGDSLVRAVTTVTKSWYKQKIRGVRAQSAPGHSIDYKIDSKSSQLERPNGASQKKHMIASAV